MALMRDTSEKADINERLTSLSIALKDTKCTEPTQL